MKPIVVAAFVVALLLVGTGAASAQSGTPTDPTVLTTVPCPTSLSSCTANDVTVTVVSAVPAPGEVCTDYQDTILVDLTTKYVPQSDRYDVGLFYATDGGTIEMPGATAKSCVGAVAPVGGGWPQPGNIFVDLDAGHNPPASDVCGDLDSKITGGVNWTTRVRVQCVPDANNNLLVNSCSVWTQDKQAICSGLSSAAGTGSKCFCGSLTFDLPEDVPFSAWVTVNKVLVPATDTGKFNLQIDGVTKGTGANVGDGGTTGRVSVGAGTASNSGATHIVGESAGTATTLDGYSTTISCVGPGGVVVGPVTGTSMPLSVEKDEEWVCTITNRTATITVDKTTVGMDGTTIINAGHWFQFQLGDTNTPPNPILPPVTNLTPNPWSQTQDDSTNKTFKVRPGTYTLGEIGTYINASGDWQLIDILP